MKMCSVCWDEKPVDQFHRQAKSRDGLQARCKTCACRLTREWAARHPASVKSTQRKKYLRRQDELKAKASANYYKDREWASVVNTLRRYRLTLDQYHAMQERQDFACAICGDDGKLTVDHDHACCKGNGSGKNTLCGKCNRGLLCSNCNNGLGCFKDTPALLASAERYLSARSA